MHLFLDTDRDLMTLWPIFGFPFDSLTQTVDSGKLRPFRLGARADRVDAAAAANEFWLARRRADLGARRADASQSI